MDNEAEVWGMYEAEVERQNFKNKIPEKDRQRIEAQLSREWQEAEIPPTDLSEWYNALSKEDCNQVMALLKKHRNLLKVGWGIGWNEASQFEWNEEPWRERTALHVGAKRGCAKLVEQVLLLFKEKPIIRNYFEVQNHEVLGEGGLFASAEDPDFLRRLLMSKDGKYELDAIAIAALHYNDELWILLLVAMRECNVYGAHGFLPAHKITRQNEDHRRRLRNITEDAVSKAYLPIAEFDVDLDFNFLPWREYLFHFLFTRDASDGTNFVAAKVLWKAVRQSSPDSPDPLWKFLLELKDGQGRTPLHVAADSPGATWIFTAVLEAVEKEINDGFTSHVQPTLNARNALSKRVLQCALNARDAAGRTALHRAIVSRHSEAEFKAMAEFAKVYDELEDTLRRRWKHPIWEENYDIQFDKIMLSDNNGFDHPKDDSYKEYIPIHRVILGRDSNRLKGVMDWVKSFLLSPRMIQDENSNRLKEVMDWVKNFLLPGVFTMIPDLSPRMIQDETCRLKSSPQEKIGKYFGLDVLCKWRSFSTRQTVELDGLELAAIVGAVDVARTLPRDWYNEKSKKLQRTEHIQPWAPLHIAANTANYDMMELFLDDHSCDPHIEDFEGNTSLHHALNMVDISIRKYQPLLFDYFNCEHIQSNDPRNQQDRHHIIDRKRCINHLLQAGCHIFKTNMKGQPPYPQGELSKDFNFVSWWVQKREDYLKKDKDDLGAAANAITITATLVATASYVGPLIPPMGFAGDPSQIQDENLWVKIFIVCDTMSLYLAIAAIILSLIPCLSLLQEQMKDEGRRIRLILGIAVKILFLSLIFVLLAFVASSFAVVSTQLLSSVGGLSTIITTGIGGLLCLMSSFPFLVRLLPLHFSEIKSIRNITDLL